jgi:hypothetical protein
MDAQTVFWLLWPVGLFAVIFVSLMFDTNKRP